MRDDINSINIPASAKKYARRKGLKGMKNQAQMYINMVADTTNQDKKGFKNKDKGQPVAKSFVESLVNSLVP